MRVLGFMTGTSLDAVDIAILETDGQSISGFGPAGERKLTVKTRAIALAATEVARAWAGQGPEPAIFAEAAEIIADEHFSAADDFLREHDLGWDAVDLIGMHGQTVLHQRPTAAGRGFTVQLGNAQRLARRSGIPVIYDFRAADMAEGGEGAPLAPLYHVARAAASGLTGRLAALNLGGLANVSLWTTEEDLVAFDTGPANGMMDLLVQARTELRYDVDGHLAAAGRADPEVVATYLDHPYFKARGPKSLDRYDFPLTPLNSHTLEDAAATLLTFAIESIALGLEAAGPAPNLVIVCGGGRLNPQLMMALRARLPAPVVPAEEVGWRGDSVEAEAFAYLAARSVRGLPLSLPSTTGVPRPLTGGRLAVA